MSHECFLLSVVLPSSAGLQTYGRMSTWTLCVGQSCCWGGLLLEQFLKGGPGVWSCAGDVLGELQPVGIPCRVDFGRMVTMRGAPHRAE